MARSEKHRFWKFLLLGMICSIIIGGSYVILSFSHPTKEVSCYDCHKAVGEAGAAPLTIYVNTTYVEVQPSDTFYLEVNASGGEPDHMMVKFPNDPSVANNSLFTYSPREIYDSDDGTIDGIVSLTTVSITSPATQGLYTIRVFAATSAYDSYKKTATHADISVNVTAPPSPPINEPPVASFTESATTVNTSEVIYFDASGSNDPDGYIVSYFWDFGDGNTGTGVTTSHSYADDGTYTVTLTVEDDDGATNSTSATKTVLNRSPVAYFTENATTVLVGETIHFDASGSYDPDGSIASYFWDFGDGTNDVGVTTDHSYSSAGTYTVTLTVTDDDGAAAQADATKTVLANLPPVASFTENATTVLIGEAIHFNASASYDPDGTIVSWDWSFGDGTFDSGETLTHIYTAAGEYTVTLTVTDDDGATANATATKIVLELVEASAQLKGVGRKPGSILPGNNVTLKAHVKNNGTQDVVFYVEFVIKNPTGDIVGMVNTTEAVEYVGDGPLWVSTLWLVPGDASAGTYTVEATLYYKAFEASEWITGNTLTLTFKVR